MQRGTRRCDFRKLSAGLGKWQKVFRNDSARHQSVDFPEASLSLADCSVSFVGLCSNRSLPVAGPVPRQRSPSVPSLQKETEMYLPPAVYTRSPIRRDPSTKSLIGRCGDYRKPAGAREGIAADYVFVHHRQPIEGSAHVARHRAQVDFNRRRKTPHPYLFPDSMAARTARKVSS
jgi:hypothetical protein